MMTSVTAFITCAFPAVSLPALAVRLHSPLATRHSKLAFTMPSRRQINRFWSLARNAGLDHAAVHSELDRLYGLSSSRDLTPSQYEEYTLSLLRRGRPEEGLYREGAYSDAESLASYAETAVRFGRLWRDLDSTDDDLQLLILLLNDFRLYRARDRRLSQKQVDAIVERLDRVPLPVFRRAAAVWIEGHRTKNERYFFGICQHIGADVRAAAVSHLEAL